MQLGQICSQAWFMVPSHDAWFFRSEAKIAGTMNLAKAELRDYEQGWTNPGEPSVDVPDGHKLIGVRYCGNEYAAQPEEAIRYLERTFQRY